MKTDLQNERWWFWRLTIPQLLLSSTYLLEYRKRLASLDHKGKKKPHTPHLVLLLGKVFTFTVAASVLLFTPNGCVGFFFLFFYGFSNIFTPTLQCKQFYNTSWCFRITCKCIPYFCSKWCPISRKSHKSYVTLITDNFFTLVFIYSVQLK